MSKKCGTCEYFLNDTYTNPDLCGICAMNANEYDYCGLLVGADYDDCEEYEERKSKLTKNENGLLPCPFCGGEAKLHYDYSSESGDWWIVDCLNDDCPMLSQRGAWDTVNVTTGWRKTEAEVIEAWNTRI